MLDQLSFLTVCDLRWKKPILTTELICLSNFKPESKITLRFVCMGPEFSDGGPRDKTDKMVNKSIQMFLHLPFSIQAVGKSRIAGLKRLVEHFTSGLQHLFSLLITQLKSTIFFD